MKLLKFAPLFLLLCSGILHSQNEITGSIVDENENAVAFANVILLNAEDSTSIYKGTISEENGSFVLNDVESSDYLLKVSFLGYAVKLQSIQVNKDLRLQPIVLATSESSLGEVTVNGRRPQVSRQMDRLIFDVENTALSTSNTFEILKRTPGVLISQGQILVKNKPATVYINDRKVYLTSTELQQLLEGFSGVNVKSVEVITNPPARYDAEGGSILNITTSKNISIGYKGSINASHSIAILPKYSAGTSQYYKNDWLNAFASYNYNYSNLYEKEESEINFYSPNSELASNWLTEFERDTDRATHSLNSILDLSLSENSTLSLSANVQLIPKNHEQLEGYTNIYEEGALGSYFTTKSEQENETENVLLNLAYNTSLGKNGGSFSANANYIDYNNDRNQDLKTMYFEADGSPEASNSFFTFGNQNTSILTGQVDISTSLGNAAFETGLKYSDLDTESGQRFSGMDGRIDAELGRLEDELIYEENIYAAYASISKDWEKWSMKAGLRGEFTTVEGVSDNFGLVNSQDYFELFPTFYLMYSASDLHSFGLDYSRRISRPRFQSLNTFRYFVNENNFTDGNPDLRPAFANKINFNYTYANKLSFDLYWERGNNAIGVLPFQNNQEFTIRNESVNMDFDQQFSLDVMYYSYLNDWWYLYFYGSVFKMRNDFFALENNNRVVTNEITSTYLQAYNQFTLSDDGSFIGELTATYLPAFISGSYEFDEPQYGVSIGLRKSFFDSRLVATVNLEDAFNSMNIPLGSRYLDQDFRFFDQAESRMLRFGLTYKFGNFRLNDNSRAIDAEESERLSEQGLIE